MTETQGMSGGVYDDTFEVSTPKYALPKGCTCDCPDGPDMHLENCESYLRYWEIDQIRRVELIYRQLSETAGRPERVREMLDEMLRQAVQFVQSVRELGDASISNPEHVMRRRNRRASDSLKDSRRERTI